MDAQIAILLAQDGLSNGAIYALLALALVLVFAVTRVIFIPQGEFVTYGALTLATLQLGKVPGTTWLLLMLGVLAFFVEAAALLRTGQSKRIAGAALAYLVVPAALAAMVVWAAPQNFRWSCRSS
jgi:branched-chain amino acid transport system permease protein